MSKHAAERTPVRSYFMGCVVAVEVHSDGTVEFTFDISEITGRKGIAGYDTENMVLQDNEREPSEDELAKDGNIVAAEIDMAFGRYDDAKAGGNDPQVPFTLYVKNGIVSSDIDDVTLRLEDHLE